MANKARSGKLKFTLIVILLSIKLLKLLMNFKIKHRTS